jgi:hypothetical protein
MENNGNDPDRQVLLGLILAITFWQCLVASCGAAGEKFFLCYIAWPVFNYF